MDFPQGQNHGHAALRHYNRNTLDRVVYGKTLTGNSPWGFKMLCMEPWVTLKGFNP